MANKVKATTHAPASKGSLPKGWRMVRFDELAQMVNERVDPSATDAAIYVGLEHLDPDSLKLRRWGTPGDVIGDKLQFRTGDIIFGRRRAYQRKLAVAEFDGICSAHAMVVRANTETVAQEFLPFLMQSDLFMQRAIDISVGSLSPTINWKTLRIQEFPLPPKDEQRRIADILRAADECRTSYSDAFNWIAKLRQSALNELFAPGIRDPQRHEIQEHRLPDGWRLVEARTLSTAPVTKGETPSGELTSGTGDFPFIKIYNLNFDGRLDFTIDPTYVSRHAHTGKLKRSRVLPGDILMNLVGPPLGKIGLVTDQYPEWNINQAIARFRPLDERIGLYLWYYLQSDLAQSWLHRRSKKTSGQRNLTLQLAQELPVPLATEEQVDSVIERLKAIDTVRDNLSRTVLASDNLAKRLSAQFLEAAS